MLEHQARRRRRAAHHREPTFALAAAAVIALSSSSLLAGFAGLFLLLLSVAALTPAWLQMCARRAARLAARASPIAALGFHDVGASLSRTGVAVAALGMALAAMIAVSVMVASFRESLRDWLYLTMRADIYISAPGPSDALMRHLDPQVLIEPAGGAGRRGAQRSARSLRASAYGELRTSMRCASARPGRRRSRLPRASRVPLGRLGAGRSSSSEPLAWRLAATRSRGCDAPP